MKRVYLKDVEALDQKSETSHVRLMEMLVDSITKNCGYSAQFFEDCRLYGIAEALIYLEQFAEDKKLFESKQEELTKLFNEIQELIHQLA